MHTLNRLLTLLVALTVLVSAGASLLASLTLSDRASVAVSLHSAVETVAKKYTRRSHLLSLQRREGLTREGQAAALAELSLRKRQVRLDVTSLRKTVDLLQKRTGLTIASTDDAHRLVEEQKAMLPAIMRVLSVRRTIVANAAEDDGMGWLRVALRDKTLAEQDRSERHVLSGYIQFLSDLSFAERVRLHLDALMAEREDLLAAHAKATAELEKAEDEAALTAEEIEQIQQITKDVHDEVLALQGELARIDTRLRSKAQRQLLEKGLIDAKDIKKNEEGTSRPPQFLWPVIGPLSAGFLDEKYRAHFGVAHLGLDIVVPEASPVYSAAEGIVFLVRDGGAQGYTYVLVGHRGGYATLYGHLLTVSVTAGQDVNAGQLIGLSGGEPGKPGSGPMTTGAHLHFEVIKNGVNVDPGSVLP